MPLFWLSLAFLAGIQMAEILALPTRTWLVLSGGAFLLWPAERLLVRRFPRLGDWDRRLPPELRIRRPPLAIVLLFLALGGVRWQSNQPVVSASFIAWYNDIPFTLVVEGNLVAPPDERDTFTYLKVQVDRLRPGFDRLFQPVQGLLLARVQPGGDWRYGDRVSLEGKLVSPFESEEFSYREYLARQGVYSVMDCRQPQRLGRGQGNPLLAVIYELRRRSLDAVYRLWPDPEASLLAGILLGVETGIPTPVQQAFQGTGTSHIIAISGFNITLLVGVVMSVLLRLLGKPRRFLAAGLAAISIAAYTLLVGANAAVVRAAVMGFFALFAAQLGRRQNGLNTLAMVAAIMALLTPGVIWDIGFQLSFMATLGLVLYADPLAEAFVRLASRRLPQPVAQRLAGPVGEYFLFTLAAQLTTLPVTVFHFQRLSWSSLLANPLILPAQPPIMALGGLALLAGLAWLPAGRFLGLLVWPFVEYTIRVVEWTAAWSGPGGGSLVVGQVALAGVVLFYALLFARTFCNDWFRRLFARLALAGRPAVVLSGMGIAVLLVWRMALGGPDGRLHLTVLNVGMGDGLLVQSPIGRFLLIDGGPSPAALSDGLGRRLPLLDRRLDWLVVGGTREEQIGALSRSLERFPAGQVLWSGAPAANPDVRSLQRLLSNSRVPVVTAEAGQVLELGDGARLEVLAAGSRGAVFLLKWGSFRAVLPVGPDFEALEALQARGDLREVSALLLADSGYAASNPPEWIAHLKPQVVLLSVAAGNWQSLPNQELLQAIDGYTLLRTDQNGWIDLSTDGERMWVEVEKR